MFYYEYDDQHVAVMNRPVRPGQLDKEQLQNLPISSIICVHHEHIHKHDIRRLVGLWEKGFVVVQPQNPQISERLYYSDYCLEPYMPPQRWNPTNWVSVVWQNVGEQSVMTAAVPAPLSPRKRAPFIPRKIDWHKAGF